jgi:hypothetical protein
LIGRVNRLLKEIAVDCLLNIGQHNFTVQQISSLEQNKNINLQLSSMPNEINFDVGDKDFSEICDYDECKEYFTCSPDAKINESEIISNTYNDDFVKMNYSAIAKRIRQLFRESNFYKRELLIQYINTIREYSDAQIDYALSRFIDNKNEVIYDKYGRTGYLINKENYYVFQPIEITDENISLFERSIPIDYKRNTLNLELEPTIIQRTVQAEPGTEDDSAISEKYAVIFGIMKQMKKIVDESIEKKRRGEDMKAGEIDWYVNLGFVFERIKLNHAIAAEQLYKYMAFHFLDNLLIDDKLVIVKQLHSGNFIPSDDVFEQHIIAYFKDKVVTVRGFKSVLFINDKFVTDKTKEVEIFVQNSENKLVWSEAPPTVRRDTIEYIYNVLKKLLSSLTFNTIFGFMQIGKNDEVQFKTIDFTNKIRKGSICMIEGKKDVIKRINLISSEYNYNEENTENIRIPNQQIVKNLIIKPGLCVILEILLRYYNETHKNNKIWFFDLEQTVIGKIVG